MSAAWSILIIVIGGIVAIAVYVATEGHKHVRGADQLVDRMVRERDEDQ